MTAGFSDMYWSWSVSLSARVGDRGGGLMPEVQILQEIKVEPLIMDPAFYPYGQCGEVIL